MAQADIPMAYTWGQALGGSGNDLVAATAADSNGNVFVAGGFAGTAQFGSTNLTATGAKDLFVAKLDPTGGVSWVRQVRGTQFIQPTALVVDSSGLLYLCGFFTGSATFGNTTLNSQNGNDGFVAKLAGDGSLVWVDRVSGASDDFANGVQAGSAGQVYLTGAFVSSTSVYPGASTTPGATLTDTNGGAQAAFLIEFASDGGVTWARSFGGSQFVSAQALALGTNGELYVCGRFTGAAIIGTNVLTSAGDYDAFLARFAANGTPAWAQNFGGSAYDFAQGVTVSTNGQICVVGGFSGSAQFGPTNVNLTDPNGFFLAALAPDGTVQWVQAATNSSGQCVTAGPGGLIYAGGNYYAGGTALGGFTIAPGGSSTGWFATAVSSNGIPQTLIDLNTSGNPVGFSLSAVAGGGLIAGGNFAGALTVLGHQLNGVSAGSGSDGFVVRLDPVPFLVAAEVADSGVRLSWPSVFSNVTVQSNQNLGTAGVWNDVNTTPTVSGAQTFVTLPTQGSQSFFRLKR